MPGIGWFVIVVVAVTFAAVFFGTREAYRAERQSLKRREQDIKFCNRLLDERAELQAGRDASLEEREAAVAERERDLRLRAQQAHATLDSEAENFDTMISVMDFELPHPNQWEDTVEVPAVEEDE